MTKITTLIALTLLLTMSFAKADALTNVIQNYKLIEQSVLVRLKNDGINVYQIPEHVMQQCIFNALIPYFDGLIGFREAKTNSYSCIKRYR